MSSTTDRGVLFARATKLKMLEPAPPTEPHLTAGLGAGLLARANSTPRSKPEYFTPGSRYTGVFKSEK